MEEEKTMIPCVAWIPKGRYNWSGFARHKPKTAAEMDKEMQELMENEDIKEEIEQYKKRQQGQLEEMGRLLWTRRGRWPGSSVRQRKPDRRRG